MRHTLADIAEAHGCRHIVEFTIQYKDAAVGCRLGDVLKKAEDLGVRVLRVTQGRFIWYDELARGKYDEMKILPGTTFVLGSKDGECLAKMMDLLINGRWKEH